MKIYLMLIFPNEHNKIFKDNYEYENEINWLNILNRKFSNQNFKSRIWKKIQILELIQKFNINPPIALKDYALRVEKNSNNIYLSNLNEKINEKKL